MVLCRNGMRSSLDPTSSHIDVAASVFWAGFFTRRPSCPLNMGLEFYKLTYWSQMREPLPRGSRSLSMPGDSYSDKASIAQYGVLV